MILRLPEKQAALENYSQRRRGKMIEQQQKIHFSKLEIPQGPPKFIISFGLIDGNLQPKIILRISPRI